MPKATSKATRKARDPASAEKNAADAARVHETREVARHRRQDKFDGSLEVYIWPDLTAALASQREDAEADVPIIHPAFGRWPENHVPNIHWDLSNPDSHSYRRPLTEDEFEDSPFFPVQKGMRLAICPQHNWMVTLQPRHGYSHMTVRCFLLAMAVAMRQQVQRPVWDSANVSRKYEIAMAYFRRTGDLPPVPTMDIFSEWKRFLISHANDQHVMAQIASQMTTYVTREVPLGYTRLQTIDLLGDNFMFAGLTYIKCADTWVMDTTNRRVASVAHHMLPRPNPIPPMNAQQYMHAVQQAMNMGVYGPLWRRHGMLP